MTSSVFCVFCSSLVLFILKFWVFSVDISMAERLVWWGRSTSVWHAPSVTYFTVSNADWVTGVVCFISILSILNFSQLYHIPSLNWITLRCKVTRKHYGGGDFLLSGGWLDLCSSPNAYHLSFLPFVTLFSVSCRPNILCLTKWHLTF